MSMAKARRLSINSTSRRRRWSRWRQRSATCIIPAPDPTEPWRSIDKWVMTPAQLGKPLGHTLQAFRSSGQRRILQVDTETCNGELVVAKPNVTAVIGPPLVQRFGMGRVPVSDKVPLSTPGGFRVSTWTCWLETCPADPGLR